MNIGVIGAGYVGSVTGSGLAELGHHVTLVDSNTAKIECYERGDVPIYEPGLPELIARNVAAGRLRFSTDVSHAVSDCAVIFVAVGTPPRHDGDADLSAIESVCRDIGLALTGYHVIV